MHTRTLKDQFHIKELDECHLEQFNKLLRYAFQVTERDLFNAGWSGEEIKLAKYPVLRNAQVFGWFDESNLISQTALYPVQMNIYNTIYKMGYITGVATYPEYAGLGLMNDLIKKVLGIMRESGQSISCLYPYSIPYYRSKGWEIVSDKITFAIKDSQVPKVPKVEGIVRRVSADNEDFLNLYHSFALRTHGALLRDSLSWEEYWRWEVEDISIALYYDTTGHANGYIVYLLDNDVFKIKEMIWLNQEARYGIWHFINAHQSMFDRIEGANYSNESLAFLLEDGHISESIQPYIMARIVDVEQFLHQYPFDHISFDTRFCFIVQDNMLEWNNKVFVLEFRGNDVNLKVLDSIESNESGQLDLAQGGGARDTTSNLHTQEQHPYNQMMPPYHVKLSIQTLTTMLLGYKRPSYLRAIERLEADEASLNILEDIIPEGKAYFSDYF